MTTHLKKTRNVVLVMKSHEKTAKIPEKNCKNLKSHEKQNRNYKLFLDYSKTSIILYSNTNTISFLDSRKKIARPYGARSLIWQRCRINLFRSCRYHFKSHFTLESDDLQTNVLYLGHYQEVWRYFKSPSMITFLWRQHFKTLPCKTAMDVWM